MTNNNSISPVGKYIDWLTVIFLVLWSGGAVTFGTFKYWELFLFPVFLYLFVRRRSYSRSSVLLLILMLLVTFFQKVKFSGDNNAFILCVVRWLDLYFISIYLIETNRFREIFVKFITVISAVSLLFYLIDFIPLGHNLLMNIANHFPQLGWENIKDLDVNSAGESKCLWFYTVRDDAVFSYGFHKNQGAFWEGGILAIYANLALYINIFTNPGLKNRTNIILVLTILSTFSTTGYISLLLIVWFAITSRRGISAVSVIYLFAFLLLCYYVMSLEFMSEKIITISEDESTLSRFGAMAYHWPQILQSPYIGYGPFLSSRFADLYMSPNGWTNMLRVWGVPMTLVFVVSLYNSSSMFIPNATKYVRFGFALLSIILVFSQTLSTSIFYYFLYFVGSYSIKTKN